jgi:hypothetical protein
MHLKTYEKQLIKAFTDKTELYQIMAPVFLTTMVDVWQVWQRGLTVSQVLEVLEKQFKRKQWDFDSINNALYMVKPKGKPQE